MAGSVRQPHHRTRGGALGITLTIALTIAHVLAAAPDQLVDAAPTDGTTTAVYVPVGPLRLADTRRSDCGCTSVDDRTIRVDVTGHSDVPDAAIAAAVTVTATSGPTGGFVTVYPSRTPRPGTSTVNTRHDRVVANSAIIPIGNDGAIELFARFPNEVIVDITGVFVPAEEARSGRYRPVTPTRLVDTRKNGATLSPGGQLDLSIPAGVDDDATAVVVNVTSVGEVAPGYLTSRPAGTEPGTTSFLNVNGSGQAIASSAILPVSTGGLTITATGGGHLIVDLLGWFTGPSAAESSVGLFVPTTPRRLLDTRHDPPRIWPDGTIELTNPVPAAGSLVTNVTLTHTDRRGFVTAYPAGTARPATSTINPAFFDHTLANLAITRVSTRGIAYYGRAGTEAIVDTTGYFTGTPVAATEAPSPNSPDRSRVLLVGDSTLAALDVYTDARSALIGFDTVIDAESCRRLFRPSCRSDTTGLIPDTAFEAILGTPGPLDIVVVKTGYNDWFSDFHAEFDAVVQASRSKGAHTILWLTYNEDVSRSRARQAYHENNVDLYRLASLPQYGDVLLADWLAYSTPRPDWFHDGTHMGREGTFAQADYISRWIAAAEHRPCPRPWTVGGPIPDPCPIPDAVGPVPQAEALYPAVP